MPNKGTDNAATGSTLNPSGSTQVTWGLRSKANTTSLGGTSHTINLPPDRQRGDALIIIVATKIRSDVSAPSGFTTIKSVDRKLHAFFKACSGEEESTVTVTSSSNTKLLATALSYYGLATQLTVYFAFNDSDIIRSLTPMASVTTSYKNGLLLYAVASEAYTSWAEWTNGAQEIADFSHGIDVLTLAVASGESTSTGTSALVEATSVQPTKSVTLTLAIQSTGVETYILGNKNTGAATTCTAIGVGCPVSVNTTSLNVRASGTTSAAILGTVASGTTGTVIDGPVSADGFTWWKVNFSSVTGWCAGSLLVLANLSANASFYVINNQKYVASIFPKVTYNSWVYRIGYYGGRTAAINAETTGSLYSVDSASKPHLMLGKTYPTVSSTGTKPGVSGGAEILSTIRTDANNNSIFGVKLAADQKYAIAVAANDASFTVNVQPNVTGDLALYTGNALSGYPDTNINSASKSSNKGHIAAWAWAETNVPPESPKLISPNITENARSISPTFIGEFRDCNGKYGSDSGQGVDRGDYISAYKVRIRYYAPAISGITNGTFELGIDGWGNEQKSTGLTTAITQDTAIKKTGTASLQVDVLTNTSGVSNTYISLDWQTIFSIAPNHNYVLSWDGFSKSTAMIPNMRIIWLDDSNNVVSTSEPVGWGSFAIDTWYTKSVQETSPPNATRMQIQIYTQITNSTSQASVYYDNITIDKFIDFEETITTISDEEKEFNKFYYTPSQPLENNSHYEWSAQTADAFGEWGPWSDWQDFWITLVGPLTAMYPTEAVVFSNSFPGYYQYTTTPTFVYKWESADNSKMYKFDFEISSYADFRDSDPKKKSSHGQTFSALLHYSSLSLPVTSLSQTVIRMYPVNNFSFSSSTYGVDKDAIMVLKIQNEYMLVESYNSSTNEFTVKRGYFSSVPATYANYQGFEIYKYNLKASWDNINETLHTIDYKTLADTNAAPVYVTATTTAQPGLTPLDEEEKYFWRARGYDVNDVPSPWSEGFSGTPSELAERFLNEQFKTIPAVYAVRAAEIDKLRSTSHRFKMYFCVWDTWRFLTTYPKLTWLKGSDLRDPEEYTEEKFKSGDADYEIRFPAEQATPSEEINVNIQQTGFAVLGTYLSDDFDCVVNLGPNRLAFVDEYIPFSAKNSWTRGNNVGEGWSGNKFKWTFNAASQVATEFRVPLAPLATYTGEGPFMVKWATPGLYTVSCSYDNQTPVERKVRVYQDRNTTHYDVVEVGAINANIQNGWSTNIVIKQSLKNPELGRLDDIQEYQSVGLFIEEEWEINGEWVRSPLSAYTIDKTCLITGYIQNGSIRIDANTHTFSFSIGSLAEQLKVVTMFGTQTWWDEYYKRVALVATPGLINQGTTLDLPYMRILDVILHLLQKWTNVLTRHDFIGWYDSSIQARDTISTNEGPLWNSLTQLAEAEYAWLYTDQGSGLRFEPNPSLRSWGAFGDLHPVPYIIDNRDIWNLDIEQKLMNIYNYCQVTGTRPYYPNSVFEGKYPSSIPEGELGQWLVKTGQMFSSQWFADFMAENFYWDANRKITGTMSMGMNRRIDIPGRIYITTEIPERDIYFDAKEFYVTGGSYIISPAESKFTSSYQIIENMYKSTGITGVRLSVLANGYIKGTQTTISADSFILSANGSTIATTTTNQNISGNSRNIYLTSSVDIYPNNLLKINEEIMLIESVSGNEVTVQRGFFSTASESHASEDLVTVIAYYKDNYTTVNTDGFIGGIEAKIYGSASIIDIFNFNVNGDAVVIYGPDQIFVDQTIALKQGKILISIADLFRELSADASVYILFENDIEATAVVKTTRTRTLFTDAIVV